MINLGIKADGNEVTDTFEFEDVTLKEAALVIYRLEEIKLKILTEFNFKPRFEVSENE